MNSGFLLFIGPIVRLTISLLVIITALKGAELCYSDRKFFNEEFTREDGIIEWATVMVLLSISALSFRKSFLASKKQGWLASGVIFLFGALEEISWGQRLFDVRVPDFFISRNVQHEMNFHNLDFGGIHGHDIIEQVLLTFLMFYLSFSVFFPRILESWKVPVPRFDQIILFLILLGMAFFVPCYKKREVLELGFSLVIFSIILWPRGGMSKKLS